MPHNHKHSHGSSCEHQSSDIDRALEKGIQYSLYQKIDLENVECLNEETEGSGKLVFKPYEQRLDFEKFVQSDDQQELLFNIPFTGNIKLKGIILIGPDQRMFPDKVKLYKNRPGMTFDEASGAYDQEIELSYDPVGEVEYTPKYDVVGSNTLKRLANLRISECIITVNGDEQDKLWDAKKLKYNVHRLNGNFLHVSGTTFLNGTLICVQSRISNINVYYIASGSFELFSSIHHLSMYFPSNFGAENTKLSYIGLKGEFTEAHEHGVTICNYELRPNLADHKNNLFDSMKREIQ